MVIKLRGNIWIPGSHKAWVAPVQPPLRLWLKESQVSTCGFYSLASEGRKKIAGQAFPRELQGIKERKANMEAECGIYPWNKVALAALSRPIILAFLKGLRSPCPGFLSLNLAATQLMTYDSCLRLSPNHGFRFLIGWARIDEIRIIHERK